MGEETWYVTGPLRGLTRSKRSGSYKLGFGSTEKRFYDDRRRLTRTVTERQLNPYDVYYLYDGDTPNPGAYVYIHPGKISPIYDNEGKRVAELIDGVLQEGATEEGKKWAEIFLKGYEDE